MLRVFFLAHQEDEKSLLLLTQALVCPQRAPSIGLALMISRGETSRLMSLNRNCSSFRVTHLSVIRWTDQDGVLIDAALAFDRSSSSS